MMRYECDCEDIRDLLSALADGEIDARRRKLVAAHLMNCPDCSRDAGRLLAAKGLVQRDESHAEVPAGFMSRLNDRLDEVSNVRRRVHSHAPARRITALAAAGAIAVSIAIIFSTAFFMRTDRGLELAQLHHQLSSGVPQTAVTGDDFLTVSCDPARASWNYQRRAILRIDGTLVGYHLFQVGNCRVSIFEGPYAWEPYHPRRTADEHIDGFDVRRIGDQSMVTWQHSAQRYVLTANAPPELLPGLARAYIRSQGRSSGL